MLGAVETTLIYTFLLGSLYLLVSLGFSLICGVLRIFHLGYAYIFTATIYFTWMFMTLFGSPPYSQLVLIISIAAMFLVQAGIAIAIYKGLIVRYIKQEEIIILGLLFVAIILEQAALRFYPIQTGVYLETTVIPGVSRIGQVTVSNQLIFAAILGIVVTGLFVLFFLKTKLGLAVRAISYDIYSSRLMGIQVGRVFMFVMVLVLIPVILATLAIAPIWAVEPSMGWGYMIIAILVSVLGGLGNIKGTIIASYIIGFVHSVVGFVIAQPLYMGLSALVVVLIMLIVRPQGIAKSETVW
ncbi:MAG: branched-chain amino acid ABC transporter permease [Dehalococcoidia bacterium]|nr:branched-chain amino acid ABC transporter permease [Dehalococcoidia bacterium]